MDMSKTIINITLADFQELQGALSAAGTKIGELTKQLETTAIGSAAKNLQDAIEHAIPLVQFAVANLPPEATKGWPFDSLTAFARSLLTIPGLNQRLVEMMSDIEGFANEGRRVYDQPRIAPTPTPAVPVNPVTAES